MSVHIWMCLNCTNMWRLLLLPWGFFSSFTLKKISKNYKNLRLKKISFFYRTLLQAHPSKILTNWHINYEHPSWWNDLNLVISNVNFWNWCWRKKSCFRIIRKIKGYWRVKICFHQILKEFLKCFLLSKRQI